MTFTLDPAKPIPKAVRKATEKQLRKIVAALTGQAGLDPDEAAHDARKRAKKLRALLRLVRPELGDDVYRRENRALRDAARRLSPVRDAWVLVETLDGLVTPPGDDLTAESMAAFRAVLAREHRDLQSERSEDGSGLRAAAEFERVLARVSRWPLRDRGWNSLDDGLERVARDGRNAMMEVREKGRTEDFHEWRKQVKYLRHQFGLLRKVWPDVLDAMEGSADELGELLGTDHDLAVLRERAESEPVLPPATREVLLRRIDARRAGLQHEALDLGRRLYAEKPASLTQRLGRLWEAAA
ncbi:MAG TPA: CHAD domain-containing protein [Acidimicrobiia bacterium]|nr:CHAD domain-containing protein [Acidimicrobiia bacterium]